MVIAKRFGLVTKGIVAVTVEVHVKMTVPIVPGALSSMPVRRQLLKTGHDGQERADDLLINSSQSISCPHLLLCI